ncbi:hypothetical protein C0584_00970 [Candidatus Parcubacteria bacterium]|nr:MAG: hypothetical protein C0584_00970 [Candidatus Parcubacteria bacterium]
MFRIFFYTFSSFYLQLFLGGLLIFIGGLSYLFSPVPDFSIFLFATGVALLMADDLGGFLNILSFVLFICFKQVFFLIPLLITWIIKCWQLSRYKSKGKRAINKGGFGHAP